MNGFKLQTVLSEVIALPTEPQSNLQPKLFEALLLFMDWILFAFIFL